MASDHIYTPTSLSKLDRRELQAIAKANNIKANLTNDQIIKLLFEEAAKKDPKGKRKRDDDDDLERHPKRIASSSSSNPAARRIATSSKPRAVHQTMPLNEPKSRRRSNLELQSGGLSKPKESPNPPVQGEDENGGELSLLPSAGPSNPAESRNPPVQLDDEDGEGLSLLQINVMNKMMAMMIELEETRKVLNGLHRKAKFVGDSSRDYYCRIRSEEARCERLRSYILAHREFRDEDFVLSYVD
ncbi:hypothetical protein BD410DRAFT_787862, partial [Rickenella mellea]